MGMNGTLDDFRFYALCRFEAGYESGRCVKVVGKRTWNEIGALGFRRACGVSEDDSGDGNRMQGEQR